MPPTTAKDGPVHECLRTADPQRLRHGPLGGLLSARETDRPDSLFRDPLARRLAGPRGEEIAKAMSWSRHDLWPWTMRTVLIDRFITDQVAQGVDTVINLAAGFDARPYRMNVPVSLNWVEIDLPELIDEKEKILADEKPRVRLERIRLDLADSALAANFSTGSARAPGKP